MLPVRLTRYVANSIVPVGYPSAFGVTSLSSPVAKS